MERTTSNSLLHAVCSTMAAQLSPISPASFTLQLVQCSIAGYLTSLTTFWSFLAFFFSSLLPFLQLPLLISHLGIFHWLVFISPISCLSYPFFLLPVGLVLESVDHILEFTPDNRKNSTGLLCIPLKLSSISPSSLSIAWYCLYASEDFEVFIYVGEQSGNFMFKKQE